MYIFGVYACPRVYMVYLGSEIFDVHIASGLTPELTLESLISYLI